MYVTYNGSDITGTLSGLTIHMSFDAVFSTVTMSAVSLMSECKLHLDDKVSYDMVLWSNHRNGQAFNMTFISKLQHKWLMSSVSPVSGSFDFSSLCSKVGVPNVTLSKTKEVYYELPRMKFHSFLEWVSQRVSCDRGWLQTFGFDGLFGIDTNTLMTASPPDPVTTPFYSIESFVGQSDHYINTRAEGSLVQHFIESDELVTEFPEVHKQHIKDTVYEFVTVKDLAWVSPNIARNNYMLNIDTSVRMSVMTDKDYFTLGSLFTDDKGSVFFVNSVISTEGRQNVVLCYLHG